MAKKQNKYYVVWRGHQTGIFNSWPECQKQVSGFPGAKYKSFLSRQEAEAAFSGSSVDYIPKQGTQGERVETGRSSVGKPILASISVDAACEGNPGRMEYRGVETDTGKILFEKGPFAVGTNNIGEFLAIVHAAAMLKKMASPKPIYSDSRTALSWVRKKRANTTLKRTARNQELFDLIEQAERWLADNEIANKILKWETAAWGEVKADYGRK